MVGVHRSVWVSLRSMAPTSFNRAAFQNGAQTLPWCEGRAVDRGRKQRGKPGDGCR